MTMFYVLSIATNAVNHFRPVHVAPVKFVPSMLRRKSKDQNREDVSSSTSSSVTDVVRFMKLILSKSTAVICDCDAICVLWCS